MIFLAEGWVYYESIVFMARWARENYPCSVPHGAALTKEVFQSIRKCRLGNRAMATIQIWCISSSRCGSSSRPTWRSILVAYLSMPFHSTTVQYWSFVGKHLSSSWFNDVALARVWGDVHQPNSKDLNTQHEDSLVRWDDHSSYSHFWHWHIWGPIIMYAPQAEAWISTKKSPGSVSQSAPANTQTNMPLGVDTKVLFGQQRFNNTVIIYYISSYIPLRKVFPECRWLGFMKVLIWCWIFYKPC